MRNDAAAQAKHGGSGGDRAAEKAGSGGIAASLAEALAHLKSGRVGPRPGEAAAAGPVPSAMSAGLPFLKMHGLGNDFVVIDGRAHHGAAPPTSATPAPAPSDLSPAPTPLLSGPQVRAIADRRSGIGCDQLLLLEAPRDKSADLFMRIFNPDGSEAQACGNGTRCVAALAMAERGLDHVAIETVAGLLDGEAVEGGKIAVDMGPARLDWREIPLAKAQDTLHLDLALEALADPVGVNIGNPHAVFFVDDVERIDLARLGPQLERHPLFPERANIEVAQVLSPTRIRMRVWERSAGITRACGSGACATLVAAARRKLTGRQATLLLDGGELEIEWLADNHLSMTGPVAISFAGRIDPSLLAG